MFSNFSFYNFILIIYLLLDSTNSFQEKINLDVLNNYSEFLNVGEKKSLKVKSDKHLENAISKSKLDVLGEIFKKNVDFLREFKQLDIIFLVDASSSVGVQNFKSELRFIKKLLSDITVDYNHTRVAVITFSSPTNTVINMDDISTPSKEYNKCLLLNDQLMNIEYKGGDTYTFGAFEKAKEIFEASNREDSRKVLFLVTDGYSNGANPVPLSAKLKSEQVTIFTIGIRNGNYKELYELSSSPGEFYSYLLDSYEEFESLARRALHVDLSAGNYIPLGFNTPCDKLCDTGNCCDEKALCSCGTTTGHYSCICGPGYYGTGLTNNCLPCTPGTYSDGPNLCLPCPDVHHTTIAPAYGIESCICKKGFQADKKGGCKILKCPKIFAPEFGYIVKKKECSNVLNSACGIRCEVGYTLVGSSIRLCQENAEWSGSDPTCEVKTCNRPPIPKYGSLKCEQEDLGVVYDKSEKYFPVDTVCTFECGKGNTLIGSSQRTCLPIAQWDGLRTICKPIKCNKLNQVKFGKIEPSSCTSGKQEYGKKCKVICNDGFKTDGGVEQVCGNSGLWSGKHTETVCIDDTPPNLECPKNISTKTVLGTNYGQVLWQVPKVTDNSRLNVSVWIYPSIINITEFKFSIGVNPVTYYAEDVFQNVIKCTFFVEVIDKEPPTIEGCINPSPFLVNSKIGENITWDEPNIFDNSKNVTVKKSRQFGTFDVGTTLVTYMASDPSGNINICNLNITIEESHCPEFISPPNGEFNCTDVTTGLQCLITCQEGYAIPISSSGTSENATSFICDHTDASWYNTEGLIFPECSVTALPEKTMMEGEVNVPLGNVMCNDTNKINEIEHDIRNSLENQICIKDCDTDLKSECYVENYEEETNTILTRRKRSLPDSLKSNASAHNAVPHKNKRNKKNKKKLNVKFQVRGLLYNNTNRSNFNIPNINGSVTLSKVSFVCPSGFIPRKSRCVQCPRGTFHNTTHNICQSCDFGYYNDKLGQKSCRSCTTNYSTAKLHAKSFKDCRGMCFPGTHGRKKKIKISKYPRKIIVERTTLQPYCKSCPIGTYQSSYGQTKCITCPNGYTTTAVGARSIEHCILKADEICIAQPSICNNGKCIVTNEYQFSCDCQQRFFGPYCQNITSPCSSNPCNNGGTCTVVNNDFTCSCPKGCKGKYCEEILEKEVECKLNCQNGGTCIHIEDEEFACLCPKGYSGDICQTIKRNCDNVICENNSTCVDVQDTFKCICVKGFLGRRCNLLPCDYKPCEPTSICINIENENATRMDYKCTCLEGYTGPYCTERINYCSSKPCQNEAECINEDTSYSCTCSKLYTGLHCEHRRNTKYMLNFSRYDINDFVRLRGFQTNLTEITACLWIQTTDSFNYGTLLSYATRFSDNVFTLTDYTGLVLYVNNNYIVTDVLLNDGYWHHICASWKSENGEYQIFVDGYLMKNGTNLASNSNLGGYGYLIVGQEQDILGGRFSQSESFVGNMAYIDIWSRTLSENEILLHLNDCSDSFVGDLYAWPEIQENIIGNVQMLNSTFCQKCKEPHFMYNGLINVVDNVAFYSCSEGYELSDKKFSNGRKCTKTSKWEAPHEPFCSKIYCGYPGFVANAYSIGNKFFYNEKITYQCYEGYRLVGSTTIVCKADGTWFPEKPQCIGSLQCNLPKIIHGTIKLVGDEFTNDYGQLGDYVDLETQITIECFDNATLEGMSNLTCLEDGSWNFMNSTCVLKQEETIEGSTSKLSCSIDLVPQAPDNAYIDDDSKLSAENGSTNFVEYKCQPGHKLIGVNISTCIIDGYWTEPNLTCQVITCPRPPTFKNMVLKKQFLPGGVYQFGNMLSYECQEGYKLYGQGTVRCGFIGRWTKMNSRCNKKSCGKPKVSANAEIEGVSYLFGDKIKIKCADNKKQELTCGKDGSWSPELIC